MHGRLNSFQKTMLQWNDLHPYSAVHAVQLPGVLDEARLQTRIQATLEARGLANLTLNRENGTFRYQGGRPGCELKILPGCDDPRSALFAEMERQLNTPFVQTDQFSPFRFFVAPAGDSFLLGLTYFHPAADAGSVVLLMKDLAHAYLKPGPPDSPVPLDLYPDSRSHLLRRHARVLVRKLIALPSQMRKMRRSHRPQCRDAADLYNRLSFFSLGPEKLSLVVAAGKAWSVTVNDLWLALLMKSLSPLASGRAQARKRRNISLGCIVNLRRNLPADSRPAFGLFLGSFTVTHEVPDGISLRALAGDLGRQTLAIKEHKLYLGTPLELGLARFMLRFFPPDGQNKFYQKNYPLWGGITNMNLNSLWGREDDQVPMDYFRGVSTGPATPLVLSVTTVRDRVNIGLSYRSAVFSSEDIQNLKCRFMNHLDQIQERT
jgi:hypothetical protein